MMKYKLLWKYPIDYRFLSVSITADGRYIVVGGDDNNVYLLKNEGDRGKFLWGYGTDGSRVESVAIAPDGNYIAAGTMDKEGHDVYLLNLEGRLLWEYNTGHRFALIGSVAISSDGNYIAARDNHGFDNDFRLSNKNVVYLFNKEGEVLWKYEICRSSDISLFGSVSITHDGNYIAAGGTDGNVYLLNREGTLMWTYRTDTGGCGCVAITPEGNYIAAGGEMTVYLLNKEGEVLWKYRTDRTGVVTSDPGVAITPDGNYIAALTGNDSVDYNLCLLSDGLLRWKYNFGRVLVKSVSMTPDGKYIAVGGYFDGNVYLFQLLNEQEVINNDTQRDINQKEKEGFPAEREVAEKQSWRKSGLY